MIIVENGVNIDFKKKNISLEIDKILDFIDKLVNHFDELSEIYKFKLLLNLYNFLLSYEDLVDFVNYKYNKKYNRIVTISTELEESNLYFYTGFIIKHGIVLDCAITPDFKLQDKRYSYKEIINLINKGKIYPIFARCQERNPYNNAYNIDEVNINKYYNNGYDYITINILRENPINVLVPNQLKLDRQSGTGWFNINEDSINEDNIDILKKILNKDHKTTKASIIKNALEFIELLIDELQKYDFYPQGYYQNEKDMLAKVRKYCNTNLRSNK